MRARVTIFDIWLRPFYHTGFHGMSCQQPIGWVEPIHFIFGYFDLEGSAALTGSTTWLAVHTIGQIVWGTWVELGDTMWWRMLSRSSYLGEVSCNCFQAHVFSAVIMKEVILSNGSRGTRPSNSYKSLAKDGSMLKKLHINMLLE